MIDLADLAMLPLWYAVFLLAITCHEAAHAFAAWRGGDPTAYHGGQVTLNPLPHIQREPMGTVVMPLVTYVMLGWPMGWASAPYDPRWEHRHPSRAALMAAAGPAANLALALVGLSVLKVGLAVGWWVVPDQAFFHRLVAPAAADGGAFEAVGRLCSILFGLNLLLAIFNMIPFPPLDGASVLAGLFEPARRWIEQLRAGGMGGMLGILVAWFVISRFYGSFFWWIVFSWIYGLPPAPGA